MHTFFSLYFFCSAVLAVRLRRELAQLLQAISAHYLPDLLAAARVRGGGLRDTHTTPYSVVNLDNCVDLSKDNGPHLHNAYCPLDRQLRSISRKASPPLPPLVEHEGKFEKSR
jgi:hypothetical protein